MLFDLVPSAVATHTSPAGPMSIASIQVSAILPGAFAGWSAVAVVNVAAAVPAHAQARVRRREDRPIRRDPILRVERPAVADALLADPAERAAVVVADEEPERRRDVERVVVAGLKVHPVGERRAAVGERHRRAEQRGDDGEQAHGEIICHASPSPSGSARPEDTGARTPVAGNKTSLVKFIDRVEIDARL